MSPRAHLLLKPQLTDRIAERMVIDPGTTPADATAEYAGRICYAAEHKPNPATATNRAYLRNILDLGHFSVLAHAACAVELEGLSRSCTHELIRAVFLAYSQESQRYVRPELSLQAVRPPDASDEEFESIQIGFADALHRYEELFESSYTRFVTEGERPRDARKRAAAVARSVLPNATPTHIVVSGNMRAWRDFFGQRLPADAEAEIREVAGLVRDLVVPLAPNSFQDLAPTAEPERVLETAAVTG